MRSFRPCLPQSNHISRTLLAVLLHVTLAGHNSQAQCSGPGALGCMTWMPTQHKHSFRYKRTTSNYTRTNSWLGIQPNMKLELNQLDLTQVFCYVSIFRSFAIRQRGIPIFTYPFSTSLISHGPIHFTGQSIHRALSSPLHHRLPQLSMVFLKIFNASN